VLLAAVAYRPAAERLGTCRAAPSFATSKTPGSQTSKTFAFHRGTALTYIKVALLMARHATASLDLTATADPARRASERVRGSLAAVTSSRAEEGQMQEPLGISAARTGRGIMPRYTDVAFSAAHRTTGTCPDIPECAARVQQNAIS